MLNIFSSLQMKIIGIAAIGLLVFGAITYVKVTNDKIVRLNSENAVLVATNTGLRNQLEQQAKSHKEEIDRWQRSVNEYAERVKQNQTQVNILRNRLSAIQDEKTKECLVVQLPSDIVDGLYSNR